MDVMSNDLLWSLFTCAVNNFKCDSLVRPYPSEFYNDSGDKDFPALKNIVEEVPQLLEVDWTDTSSFENASMKLLTKIVNPNKFVIKYQDKQQAFKEIQRLVEDETCDVKPPDFIFKIDYNSGENQRFRKMQSSHSLLYGYHGSRIENFYSILHNGLINNLNKVSVFGEGIYLSSDLRVSLAYSPTSGNWKHSLFGNRMGLVAVCEVVDHPAHVKCSTRHAARSSGSLRSRSFVAGSEGGQVPEKYYVVRNDDLVRVRYLLVHAPHANQSAICALLCGSSRVGRLPQGSGFASRHRFVIVMAMYVGLLLLLSAVNSNSFSRWWQAWRRKQQESHMHLR